MNAVKQSRDDKCEKHGDEIALLKTRMSVQEERMINAQESLDEIKSTVKDTVKDTQKLQIRTTVIHTIILILFGIGNAVAVKIIVDGVGGN